MVIERTKNTIRNTIYGLVSSALSIFLPFVVRTVLLKVLGAEYLGLSSLFTSILNLLNLTELGVNTAIVFSMYKAIADDDRELIDALINLYKKIYRIIGAMVLGLGLIIAPFLRFFISGDVPKDVNIYLLFFIYLSNSVLSYWLFAYRTSLLVAHQRNDVVSKTTAIVNFVSSICQIIVLLMIKNYYVYVLFLPLSTLFINILNYYFSTKMFSIYHPFGQVDKETKKEIRRRVSGLMIDKIAGASRSAFDSIVISSSLGLIEVAIYNNYHYVIVAVGGFLTVFLNSLAAGIGNSIASDSIEKNESDFLNINFLFCSIGGMCFCFFVTLYQPFMIIWVGEGLLASSLTMIAFSFYFMVGKFESIVGRYYDASGLWWVGKWKGVAEAATNLVLNVTLCYFLGVFGVVLATIISMLFVAIPLETHFLFKYYFKKSPKSFVLNQFLSLLIFLFIGIIIFSTNELIVNSIYFFQKNVFVRLIFSFFYVVFAFIVLYLVIFAPSKRFVKAKEWLFLHIRLLKKK